MKRVVTALLLLPLALYGTFFAQQPVFIAIVALVALICYYEYAGITEAHGLDRPGWWVYGAALFVLWNPAVLVLIGIVVLALALRLPKLSSVLPSAAAAVFGVVYIFGGWHSAILLREMSPQWLLFALAINWVGDIAAYYTGRAFGRHKLAPRVSPGKSREGAIGSLVFAVAFGVLFRPQLGPEVTIAEVVLLSVLGNIAGQLGDLAESAMKRGAGVKDSGSTLPGHGGWLDRLDSSLFSMPVVYWVHLLATRGLP